MKIEKNYLSHFALMIILLYGFSFPPDKSPHEDTVIMRQAASRMEEISDLIRTEKLKRGIPMDLSIDPNQTGLLGEEFTEITTTLGNLESKRTSTNPDFSALFVKILMENGIGEGDRIGVNMSSSFPALNLSLISAIDLLGIDGVIINSMGASTYGANNIHFTYLDMEDFLLSKGAIKNHSLAYSLGGDNDLGNNFQEGWKERLLLKKDSKGRELIHIENLKENLDRRLSIYKRNGDIKMFISIGGNLLSEPLLQEFKRQGIPVLSFLNIKSLASSSGIPIDPVPIPIIGTSPLYKIKKISIVNYLILLLIPLYGTLLYIKKRRRN